MSRGLFLALSALIVRDCDVTGPRPGTVITGTWGGDNAGLIADDTSAHAHQVHVRGHPSSDRDRGDRRVRRPR